ncbi:sulfatase family protein [Marinilabilia rubra]|uniref:Sulfatase N-terminal domain-containing protein n=1 Tax=Marinilabilia rubra TaxID=2162893 RepID=A0A2U2B7D2_9BACT|nr:sulfatase-like hydrolase/transferase [Marinilabilia rubra]PWD98956.1 hypothetical protein DDZ16_13245 [Marinilabilia rubra]
MKRIGVVLVFLLAYYGSFVASQEQAGPNVVFIISDQHKLDALGCYGDEMAITPNIDKLAEEGVRLTNCYTPAPVCAPARAAMMTGMYPAANGAPYHKAPVVGNDGKIKDVGTGRLRETGYYEELTTLAQVFRQNGYATGSPGKMHTHGELQTDVDPAMPEGNDMGFDEVSVRYYTHFPGGHYEDEVGTDTYQRYRVFEKYNSYRKAGYYLNTVYKPTLVKKDEENFDMVVTKKAVEFIDDRANDNKNFFLHVGLEKPHPPFTTTKKYLDMYDPDDFELPDNANAWYGVGKYPWLPDWIHNGLPQNPQEAKNAMASYYACVTEVDDMVGRIVNRLKENGLYDNTVIIYTTDHGEHLFEHGLRGKHCMLEDAVNIPFIISFPEMMPQNEVNESLVSLIDMMPTFCDLMGWDVPETAQGKSVLPFLKNGYDEKDRKIFAEFRGGNYNAFPEMKNLPSRMLRTGDLKFIYTHGMANQLYHVVEDPDEENNLAFEMSHYEKMRDLCFQTIAGWEPQEYHLMKTSLTNKTINWDSYDNVEEYVVYYSETADPESAVVYQEGITETFLTLSRDGYYWVMAVPGFSRTAKRTGNIPVFREEYTLKLPVSGKICVQRNI